MPINGRRIDELPNTSGNVIEASDLFHLLDSVAGGYTNKKISVEEFRNYIGTDFDAIIDSISAYFNNFIPLSGSDNISGNLIPYIGSTYSLGTSATPWSDIYISSGSVYFYDQKLSIDNAGNIYVNDILFKSGIDLEDYPNYAVPGQQVISHTDGVIQWEDVNTVGDISLLSHDVNQVAHGFVQTDAIYNDAISGWIWAQADNIDTLGVAVVTAVADDDNFTYKTQGAFTYINHGFPVGEYLYVNDTTPGFILAGEPIGITSYSNPLMYVLDVNTFVILPYRSAPSIPRSNDHRIILTSASEYIVNDVDEVIVVHAAVGGSEIILPDPSDTYYGFTVTIKKSDSTTEVVTVKSMYGDIDDVLGTTGIELTTQNEVVTAVCDSVNYTLI